MAGLWLLGGAAFGVGQSGPAAPAASAEGVLLEMATHAGVIFTGQVVGVERADASGYVDVRFRVDHAVRGVSRSGAYVLREWAGLWSVERYRVGQRFLMLLTARGTSGMSAPVDGMDGAIPLIAGAAAPLADAAGSVAPDLSPDGTLAGTAAAPELRVDVRWLQVRATRVAGEGTVGAGWRSMKSVSGRHEGAEDAGSPVHAAPVEPGTGSGESLPWLGAIAPLASLPDGRGDLPGVPLSTLLALLQGSGASVHEGR